MHDSQHRSGTVNTPVILPALREDLVERWAHRSATISSPSETSQRNSCLPSPAVPLFSTRPNEASSIASPALPALPAGTTAVVYCEGVFGEQDGKTANGLVRHSEKYEILSVIDSVRAGVDAGKLLDGTAIGIPVLASLGESISHAGFVPDYLICGLAPADGLLSDEQRVVLIDGIARGMHIINGLHEFLNDDAEFVAAAVIAGVTITDVRRPKAKRDLHLFSGRIFDVTCPRIAVLGTDGAIGKRTTATLLVQALNARGIKAVMVGTGQTTLIQGGKYGVALDALVPQFCSGEVEHQVVAAFEGEDPDVIVVEGQGALSHPAYLTSAHILRGSRPAGVIVQHAPKRKVLGDFPMVEMPTAASEIALIEAFADTRVIGVTINHEDMTEDELSNAISEHHSQLGLPVTDPLTRPASDLVDMVLAAFPALAAVADIDHPGVTLRIEADLDKVEDNTRVLVDRLAATGIRVTGITKAVLGSPGVGAAMLRGGAGGLGDSRVSNLARLAELDRPPSRTLIRSPMLSQVARVIEVADVSLNTESVVLAALDQAASQQKRLHGVVLMVELGDLREGIVLDDVPEAVRVVLAHSSLRLVGLGANLACQNGVIPDDRNMGILTGLADDVEALHGISLDVVSGGNSANLSWALHTHDVGRIDELRLGEAILLGVDPLYRTPIPGLHTDAFTLIAEVIEVAVKPAQPWGDCAQAAFGEAPVRTGTQDCSPGDPGPRSPGRGPGRSAAARGHHDPGNE